MRQLLAALEKTFSQHILRHLERKKEKKSTIKIWRPKCQWPPGPVILFKLFGRGAVNI